MCVIYVRVRQVWFLPLISMELPRKGHVGVGGMRVVGVVGRGMWGQRLCDECGVGRVGVGGCEECGVGGC